jgi:hypothetical protein
LINEGLIGNCETSRLRRVQKWIWSRRPCLDFFWFFKVNFLVICPSKVKILIWKLKGKWHFEATFIDNEGKNVIGCLMNITGARGTDHPPFCNFLLTNWFSIKFLYFFIISSLFPYFNLFVSIFIQSYVNIKLHVSTLLEIFLKINL